ncbi:MAG: hypothetical protein RPR40_10205 [Bermanella sp.]
MNIIAKQESAHPPCDLGCAERDHCARHEDTCCYFAAWADTGRLNPTLNATPHGKRPKKKKKLYRNRPAASAEELKRQADIKARLRALDTGQLGALANLISMRLTTLVDYRTPSHALSKNLMRLMASGDVVEFLQRQGIEPAAHS